MGNNKIIFSDDNSYESKKWNSLEENETKHEENVNIYAGQLPKWDIVPPTTVIRRVRRVK